MSSYLAYSYSANLTEEEQATIDKYVKKSREEFGTGFQKGLQISVSVYSLYRFSTPAAAHAAEIAPDLCPAPADNPGAVKPAPNSKPGFQPLHEGAKGTFVGGAGAVCAAALQSGDFALGVACAALLVVAGIVINRPPHN
jgi:hypothetical protein